MVVYSLQNQINNLEMDVKIQKGNIAKLQSFADSLPEGERKEFYLWKIKSEREHVADLEQEISDLERRLHFATSY
jgi:cell division protein FtsL